MGATKKHIYTQKQIDLANFFKAFSEPSAVAKIDKYTAKKIKQKLETLLNPNHVEKKIDRN